MLIVPEPFPQWDERGFLPPYTSHATDEEGRSPYPASLVELISRFGFTAKRREILTGFLNFRAALHAAGIVQGFQWVNGSFVEDKMWTRGSEPDDIDLVTFYRLPSNYNQSEFYSNFPHLFDQPGNKDRYHSDTYFVALDTGNTHYLSRWIAYWNSLFSHTRAYQWKGYLEIDLSDAEDVAARNALSQSEKRGATQ